MLWPKKIIVAITVHINNNIIKKSTNSILIKIRAMRMQYIKRVEFKK